MSDTTFSYLIFWKHPLSALCFFAFAMSFVSLWIRKTVWLWGAFAIIAYLLAFQASIVSLFSLVPIGILWTCHYLLHREIYQGTRFLLFGIAILTSAGLIFHFLPGFHNFQLLSHAFISPNAYSYNLFLNFDKPWIGLFALVFGIPLLSSKQQWIHMLKVGLPLSILGILIIMSIALSIHLVQWNPKLPFASLIWILNNLLFVSIPEEAFFRGFIQKELKHWTGKGGAVFCTSLLFTLLHLLWVANLPFLTLVFVASLIYGTIYEMTQAIEASILCHFGLNLTHFLLFTYPALEHIAN